MTLKDCTLCTHQNTWLLAQMDMHLKPEVLSRPEEQQSIDFPIKLSMPTGTIWKQVSTKLIKSPVPQLEPSMVAEQGLEDKAHQVII